MTDQNKLSSTIALNTQDFKAHIAELNRDLRVVKSEFAATAATFVNWTKDINGLEARVKSLNSQIEIQGKKVAEARAQHERMVAAHGANSKAAQDAQVKYNNETASLNKMKTELSTTEKAMDALKKSSDNAGKSAQENSGKFEGFRKVLGGVTAGVQASIGMFVGLIAILVATAAAMGGLVISSASAADKLAELSAQTRISTDKLQEMQFVGALLGTGLEVFTGSQTKLIRSMQAARDGTGEQAEAFARLGIRVTDAKGQLRDSQKVFDEAIDALGRIKNPTEQDAAAMAIFGKSAQELNPLIAVGSEGLKKYAQQARDVGAVVDAETVQKLSGFKDQLDTIQLGLKGTASTVAASFLPAFSGLADEAMQGLKSLHQVVENSNGDLVAMAKGAIKLIGIELRRAARNAPEMLDAGLDVLRGVTDAVVKGLPSMVPAAQRLITSFVGFLGQALPLIAGTGLKIVIALVRSLLPALPGVVDAALNIITTLAEALTEAAPVLLPAVAQTIASIAKGLVERAPALLLTALTLLTALAQGLTEAIAILGPVLPQVLQALVDGLLENRQALAFAAGELIGALARFMVESSDQMVQVMIAIGEILLQSLPPDLLQEVGATLIAGFLTGISNGSSKAAAQMLATFNKEWAAGLAGWQNFFNGLGRFLQNYIAQSDAGWRNFFNGIRNAVAQYFTDSLNGWNNFFAGLGNLFNQSWIGLVNNFNGFLSSLVSAVRGVGQNLYDAGEGLISSLWQGIQDSWAGLLAGLQGLINQIPEGIKNLLGLGTGSGAGGESFGTGASAISAAIAQANAQMQAAMSGLNRPALAGASAGVTNNEAVHLTNLGTINIGAQTPSGIAKEIKQQARRY